MEVIELPEVPIESLVEGRVYYFNVIDGPDCFGSITKDGQIFSITADGNCVVLFKKSDILKVKGPAVITEIDPATWAIVQERSRQIELWGDEHDDIHVKQELRHAARSLISIQAEMGIKPPNWPFEDEHWKNLPYPERLIRAGAFIASELARILRLEAWSEGKVQVGDGPTVREASS